MKTRKVNSSSFKLFGETWKHQALKAYNGKEVSVEAELNKKNQTELTVMDGETVICVIGRE